MWHTSMVVVAAFIIVATAAQPACEPGMRSEAVRINSLSVGDRHMGLEEFKCETHVAAPAVWKTTPAQLRRFSAACKEGIGFEDIVSVTYSIMHMHGASLDVMEELTTASGDVIRGGSSLFSIADSGSNSTFCDVADRGHGAYSVICPPSPWDGLTTISIQLEHPHYAMFASPLRLIFPRLPVNAEVLRCSLRAPPLHPPLRIRPPCTAHLLSGDRGRWIADKWSPTQCELVTDFSSCQGGEVLMLGASHMRYLFDAVAHTQGMRPELPADRKHGDATIGDFTFKDANVAERVLTALSWNATPSPASILAVQTGSHDLNLWPLARFMRRLDMMAAALQEQDRFRSVIVFSSPPVPSSFSPTLDDRERGYRFTGHGVSRNNAALLASAEHLEAMLRADGKRIVFIPFFHIAYPRHQRTACDIHYLCRDRAGELVRSPAGEAMLSVFMNAWCTL